MGFGVELRWSVIANAAVSASMLLIMAMSSSAKAQTGAIAQPDVASIIAKSVEANDRDWDAEPQYDYTERDRDAHGPGTKTYAVTMVLGSPYERLVAINGKELSSAQKKEEQKKYDQMLSARKSESPEEKAKRVSSYEAGRRRDHEMLTQLTKAFDFTLEGEQTLAGRPVYVLNATPRAGYQPPNRDCEVLPGMQGKLWIDEASFQWVKVEAHVMRPVSIEGFLAQVEPGTKFELEKTPVNKDIWLPKHYAMRASAKVLFIVPHHSHEDETYFNYHQSQSSSNTSQLRSQSQAQYANSRPANP